jgi:hypothetical protein
VNDIGTYAFQSDLAPSPSETSIYSQYSTDPDGLWLGTSSASLVPLALSAAPVDGPLGRFGRPIINAQGDVLVRSQNFRAVSIFRNGQHQFLGTKEMAVPGDPGVVLNQITDVALSDYGKAVFFATMMDPLTFAHRGTGLWVDAGAGLTPVALPGMPTLLGDGSVFTWFFDDTTDINAAGRIAFVARVQQGTQEPYRVLFAEGLDGALHKIVAQNELLSITLGDARTVECIVHFAINDRGEVMFHTLFTDGTQGIFVSNAVAVPEPSTLVLCGGVFGLLWGRSRHSLRLRRKLRPA